MAKIDEAKELGAKLANMMGGKLVLI